jgi:glycopeptide antibiotics resistance protein
VFTEVPVLPVVVPLAAVVLAGLLWHLHRAGRLSVPRAAVALALCGYAAGVVANTVFPIFLDLPRSTAPWWWSIDLRPLGDYEVVDAVQNMVVFGPLGVLVPLLIARVSWWRVLAVAAASSLAIEVAQFAGSYFLDGGHVADVNDLIFNVAGAAVGFALFSVASRVPGAGPVIDRFRWASARSAAFHDDGVDAGAGRRGDRPAAGPGGG